METKSPGFWWMKTPTKQNLEVPLVPKLDLHSSTSLTDILGKDSHYKDDSDVDVGSIIDEINRVAAQSPLGPYEKSVGERSIDDIMKEAEKIYMESSKSFEQLSQRSKTSQNITDFLSSQSNISTPTPKSISPLPMDPVESDSDYSEDFSQESKASPKLEKLYKNIENIDKNENNSKSADISNFISIGNSTKESKNSLKLPNNGATLLQTPIQQLLERNIRPIEEINKDVESPVKQNNFEKDLKELTKLTEEIEFRNELIKTLEEDNKILKSNIYSIKLELEQTRSQLEKLTLDLNAKSLSSPEINLELEKALEELKDTKEINTSLQLQLDTVNKTHQLLKSSYDELVTSNKTLERKVVELDTTLARYKSELYNAQQAKDKALENEINLNKLLEIEKLQCKSLKLQNEKDSKCIQDLNRQIKEMERIIARKHPDSVSALIVAAKEDPTDNNLTARKLLEDRIKVLEQEVVNRDSHSSKIFMDIQEKFNQMKNKYENHIEDLELHVSDLKNQLNRKGDTFDVYTQTNNGEKIPQKETFTTSTQTVQLKPKPVPTSAPVKRPEKELKEDAHLLATIRGLQTDLSNKEKVITKLQKEIDEARKTNRKLQKEREGSLRNISDRKEFRSYPERLSSQSRSNSAQDFRKEEELQQVKTERDRLKQQLSRIEDDYQSLKKKRLEDLTALQEAHEREVANYVTSVTPLREQLELQQVSISTLQSQLVKAKEELAVVTVEKDHLSKKFMGSVQPFKDAESMEVEMLLKKIDFLEKRYEEREHRLRAIVQSLAQRSVTNKSCEQCAARQQELISYRVELDQILASVRALQ